MEILSISMFAIILCVVCILTGISLLYQGRKEVAFARQSRRWPHVIGRVSEKFVHEGTELGMTTNGTFAPTTQAYRMSTLVYTYSVDGTAFRSWRINFSDDGWECLGRYYEDGESVVVYYCPSEPSVSVLKTGGIPRALINGLGFVLAGVISLILALSLR